MKSRALLETRTQDALRPACPTSSGYTSSDVEQACPIIQLLDSDHEEDSEFEIE